MTQKIRYIPEKAIIRLIGPYYKGCCPTCHDDEMMGYDLCELELGKNRYAYVCCEVAIAFRKWYEDKHSNTRSSE